MNNKKILAPISVITALAVILIPLIPVQAQGRPQSTILNVPFIRQAPFGNWDDRRQQYGCEEASIVMAMAWVRSAYNNASDVILREEALRDIINMSEYQKVIYGVYEDTNAQDTARVVREFYQHSDVTVTENISVEHIRMELSKNRVVIVPLNTQLTGLPIYKNGPVRHTVIVVGYDDKNDEIIINDPIVQNGGNMWIPAAALDKALWNYTTGNNLRLPARTTAMVSIGKAN